MCITCIISVAIITPIKYNTIMIVIHHHIIIIDIIVSLPILLSCLRSPKGPGWEPQGNESETLSVLYIIIDMYTHNYVYIYIMYMYNWQ